MDVLLPRQQMLLNIFMQENIRTFYIFCWSFVYLMVIYDIINETSLGYIELILFSSSTVTL